MSLISNPTEIAVRKALLCISDKKPVLATLIHDLPSDCHLSPGWLNRLSRARAEHDSNNVILRTLVGDESRPPWRDMTPIDSKFKLSRTLEYLAYSPDSYLAHYSDVDPVSEEVIPRTIKRMRVEHKKRCHCLALSLAVSARDLELGPQTVLARDQILVNFFKPMKFYRDLVEGKRTLHPGMARALFQTAPADIRGANLVAFLAAVSVANLNHGKAQDKIPAALMHYLGLPFRSLPVMDSLTDVLSLRSLGCIDALSDRWEPVYQDVKAAMDKYDDIRLLWRETIRWHGFMTPAVSDLYQSHRDNHKNRMVGYSSLRFNLVRRLNREIESIGVTEFQTDYSRVDRDQLESRIIEHLNALSPSLVAPAFGLMAQLKIENQGIGQRDIANILVHAWFQAKKGRSQWEALPPVARFALGESEPVRPKGRQTGGRKPGRNIKKPMPVRPDNKALSDALKQCS